MVKKFSMMVVEIRIRLWFDLLERKKKCSPRLLCLPRNGALDCRCTIRRPVSVSSSVEYCRVVLIHRVFAVSYPDATECIPGAVLLALEGADWNTVLPNACICQSRKRDMDRCFSARLMQGVEKHFPLCSYLSLPWMASPVKVWSVHSPSPCGCPSSSNSPT